MMKKLILGLLTLASISALADSGSTALEMRLNGQTLVCKSAGKEVGRISAEKGQIKVSDGLCWSGRNVKVEVTSNFVIVTCSDDGGQTTTLNLSKKLIKNADAIDGATYANISAGYPYEDGSVQYLICAAK